MFIHLMHSCRKNNISLKKKKAFFYFFNPQSLHINKDIYLFIKLNLWVLFCLIWVSWPAHYLWTGWFVPRFKDTIVNAKYGGHTEAVRRLLGQLPISAQSYSSSPYLDLSLFSYDDKWVSVMERPKTCGDHPIR